MMTPEPHTGPWLAALTGGQDVLCYGGKPHEYRPLPSVELGHYRYEFEQCSLCSVFLSRLTKLPYYRVEPHTDADM